MHAEKITTKNMSVTILSSQSKAIQKYFKEGDLIHNSSWGTKGIHITFKERLDSLFKNVHHSDIIPSTAAFDPVSCIRFYADSVMLWS